MHRRADHGRLEPRAGVLEHRELERLLGPEMGEQAALGQLRLLGQRADREPAQPDPPRHVDRLVEHREPSVVALTHAH